LHAAVDFKGLTPGQHWDATGPDEVTDVLQEWFEPQDDIKELRGVTTGEVADRSHISYRFAVTSPDGDFEVEQQMYYEHDGSVITMMRILCSGFRPLDPASAT
jgi:hypothetical protein